MNTIHRLKRYIDSKGISMRQFERTCGISNGSFGSQLRGEGRTIGVDKLENILQQYSDINTEWLLTGSGPMLKSELPLAIPSPDGIPLISIEAMAGFSQGEVQVIDSECEKYVIPIFKGAEFLIPVKGSSMYPKYNSGDLVACKHIPLSDIFFQWNKVYVLNTVQGPLVKRVCKGSDSEHVLIVSDNPKYEPFELNIKEHIYDVAIVIGVVRLE